MNIDPSEFIEQHGVRSTAVTRRFSILTGLLIVILGTITGRGAYLQVMKGRDFRARAEHNRLDSRVVPAPRGILYDKHGTQLVENISSTDLVVNPVELPSTEHDAAIIDRLIQLLPNLPPKEIQASIVQSRNSGQTILLVKAIDHDTVLAIEEMRGQLPGIELASSLVRKYFFGQSLAHLLGYTSPVTAEELTADSSLIVTDTTGKQGIEKTYDSILRGQHGFTYTQVNAVGTQQVDVGSKPPIPGEDITLTIDANLQQFIYGLFSEKDANARTNRKEPIRGAVVVLDSTSGAVRALVSYPSYDPNVFSQPSLRSHASSIFQNPLHPLFNRAVDGTYPSGSTIKPFLAAAALQEGVITPETTVRSTGGIQVGPWRFADWKPGGHGITNVQKALAESVNTFFYMVAGGLDGQAGLGIERATKYLHSFGWGEKTGIDLSSEATGFLPSPQWKLKTTGQPWYIGDTYHLGIGQGDVLATPLQVAAATGAIAHGMYWYTPHLIEGAITKHSIPIRQEYIEVVQAGMRQAVTEGSARALATLALPISGKTGTAQIGGTEKTHAWFTSFGPLDTSSLVVTILLEEGGGGDTDAVPLAQEIWQYLAEHAN